MPRELLIMQNSFQWGTAEGQTLEIENAIRSRVRDLKIEGQTYQNLLSETKSLGKFVYNDITGEYTLTNPSAGAWNTLGISYTRPIQAGEKLLIRINIVKNTIETTDISPLKITFSDGHTMSTGFINIENGVIGLFEYYCDGASTYESDSESIYITTRNYTSGELVIKDIQVIPVSTNPLTYTELPTSINGIESVAEREFEQNLYTEGDVNVKGTNPYMNVKKQINVKPNTTYVVRVDIESINKGDNNFPPRLQIKKGSTLICETMSSTTFNSGDNTTLDVAMYVNNAYASTTECEANFKNIKIYESDSYPIIISQSCNETDGIILPNGVKNTIENGVYLQNVYKFIIDENAEMWTGAWDNQVNTIGFNIVLPYNRGVDGIISSYLTAYINNSFTTDREEIHCTGTRCRLRILRSKLETEDIAGFKKFLKSNPITIYYALATPVTQPLALTKINLPQPLRSLPNGVRDTIEGNKLIQNIYELKIDSNFDFNKSVRMGSIPTDTSLCRFDIGISITTVLGNVNSVISNIFPYLFIHELAGGSGSVSQECVSNHTVNRYGINVVIKKSRLTSVSVDGFKEWCIANNFKILYQLETPIVHDLTIPSIYTEKGTNIITTANNIKPKLNIKVKVKK